jgi:hypothetical protein
MFQTPDRTSNHAEKKVCTMVLFAASSFGSSLGQYRRLNALSADGLQKELYTE